MDIFLSFLPWIAFLSLADAYGVRWVSLISAAIAAAIAARSGFKLLDLKSALFFLLLFGAAFVVPEAWLTAWAPVIGSAAIFLIVMTTIVIGRPFTTPYAKRMTPPEVWDTPTFKRANQVISLGWAAGFGVALAAAIWTAFTAVGRPWLQPTAQIASIIGPLLFQTWYRRRLMRAAS
jgi:hypothetical protein